MDFSDPIIWRGIERILIVIGAIFLSLLGYKLYIKGVTHNNNELQIDSKLLKFILSGQGPGLFFMAFSSLIFIWAISLGEVETHTKRTVTTQKTELPSSNSLEQKTLPSNETLFKLVNGTVLQSMNFSPEVSPKDFRITSSKETTEKNQVYSLELQEKPDTLQNSTTLDTEGIAAGVARLLKERLEEAKEDKGAEKTETIFETKRYATFFPRFNNILQEKFGLTDEEMKKFKVTDEEMKEIEIQIQKSTEKMLERINNEESEITIILGGE